MIVIRKLVLALAHGKPSGFVAINKCVPTPPASVQLVAPCGIDGFRHLPLEPPKIDLDQAVTHGIDLNAPVTGSGPRHQSIQIWAQGRPLPLAHSKRYLCLVIRRSIFPREHGRMSVDRPSAAPREVT